ncbi:MAG TPA: hypothetical protein VI877_03670 [Dehalococcoidia bacterium]|nr:hypothetical protein [Dehalococcoidia bacterium]
MTTSRQQVFKYNSVEEKIQQQLDKVAALKGTGPLSTAYARWVDQTVAALTEVYGEESPEVRAFAEAVGQRGIYDSFGLPLRGPWGLREGLERGEAALRQILAGA